MKKFIQKSLLFILTAFLVQSCEGNSLFRTAPCSEGQVRKGDVCVSESDNGNSNCKDPDLNKVHKNETITLCDGSLGVGTFVPSEEIPLCKKDGDQECVAKSNFKAVDLNNLSSRDFKNGKVIAGITGSLRTAKFCRNYSSLSSFDASYPPSNLGVNGLSFAPAAVALASDQITLGWPHGLITNSPITFTTTTTLPAPLVVGTIYYAIYVSDFIFEVASVPNGTKIDITTQGTGSHNPRAVADNTAQYFDTIEDYNGGAGSSPSDNPWSSSDFLCDTSNFVNVTSASDPLLPSGAIPPPGNRAFTQIWQDQISGVYVSNIIAVNPMLTGWSGALRACESLNGGTAGEGWRLPTQKELLQLYIHGIAKVPLSGGSTNTSFWSSSLLSSVNAQALAVNLSVGTSTSNSRTTSTFSALCIR